MTTGLLRCPGKEDMKEKNPIKAALRSGHDISGSLSVTGEQLVD